MKCLTGSSVALVILALLPPHVPAAVPCATLRNYSTPQPQFSRSKQQHLLETKRTKTPPRGIKEESVKPELGNYSFSRYSGPDSVVVTAGKPYLLRFRVPAFDWRPLSAHWINAKLLYLEVWFNPHYGAWWLYDVDREQILAHELQNDGQDLWLECRERGGPKHGK